MKSFLYVGATLMIGASVYGFVDYSKTSRSKEFSNMYKEKEAPVPTAASVTNGRTISPTKKEVPASQLIIKEKLAVVNKPELVGEETIAPIKPIADDEKMVPVEQKEMEKTTVDIPVPASSGIEKKKRRLSPKLFSRAALDERYIEPKVKKD